MKKKSLIFLLLAIIILCIGFAFIYYAFFKVVYVQKATYSFSVSDHVGLVGDKDAIKFGGITAGGWGRRGINFTNHFDFPVKINIKIKGENEEWIIVSQNNFILQPGVFEEVKIQVNIPGYASLSDGNYTGIVTAYYIKI